MAKAKQKEISVHSRAARRGVAPAPNTPAAKNADAGEFKPWLHTPDSAGISKKKKSKPPTRQQRLRQQKLLEHAERNTDRHEKKVADSKSRAKKVQARAKAWEELNEGLVGKDKKPVVDEDEWTDEEENDDAVEEKMPISEDVHPATANGASITVTELASFLNNGVEMVDAQPLEPVEPGEDQAMPVQSPAIDAAASTSHPPVDIDEIT